MNHRPLLSLSPLLEGTPCAAGSQVLVLGVYSSCRTLLLAQEALDGTPRSLRVPGVRAKQSRVSCIHLSQTSWFLPDQGLSLSGHSQPESSLESVHETLTFCHFYLNPELFAKPADQWLLSPALSLGQMSTVPACALSVLVFWFRPACPLHRSLFTAEVFCQSEIAKS